MIHPAGTTMTISESKGPTVLPWKVLYQAAIAEPDLNKLPERLCDAEAALISRARELFYVSADDGEEGESLDNAMYILHALRQSLSRRAVGVVPQASAMTVSRSDWDVEWQTA
jgi:hypothetical protein